MSGGTGTAQRRPILRGRPYLTGGRRAGGRPAPRQLVSGAGPAIQLASGTSSLDLGALDSSPGCARDYARAVLSTWEVDADVIDTAQLLVSELITNAVQATQRLGLDVPSSVGLRLTDRGRHVLIEVADANPNGPDPQDPEADAEHGRGLLLVDTLAVEWGYYETDAPGKVVWAKVTCDPAVVP
jgi:anti-sigma regulatory factor (Ser/Thr protein kinase)